RKRWIFQQYVQQLADIPDFQFNAEPPEVVNGAWITAVVFGRRHRKSKQQAMQELAALGVPSRPFVYPLSSLPAYRGKEDTCRARNPVAYDISPRGITLPGALNLPKEQIDFGCHGLRSILDPAQAAPSATGAAA